jgi:tRNA pseudouridine38-40 synthase
LSSRRLKLVVEYDGTDFGGWQRQPNAPTIQAALEDALAQMTSVPTAVRGAGRTDAGVHALGQVAHFDTEAKIPTIGFLRGLNQLLPRQIAVIAAAEVAADFDARFSASGKLYRYNVWNREARSPRLDRFAWHTPRGLDVEAMRSAAATLVGRHDFAAFRASDCERKTTHRTVTRLEVSRDGDLISLEIEADAFLKNMVRIITGTLVEVGWGTRPVADVATILASGDRTRAGRTAPACGLTMVRVDYARTMSAAPIVSPT